MIDAWKFGLGAAVIVMAAALISGYPFDPWQIVATGVLSAFGRLVRP